MTVNSSSIPALRIARAVKRKKRASGGEVYDPMTGVQIGADTERTEPEYGANKAMRGVIQAVAGLPKAVLWDLPHNAIRHSMENPYPGLRREDYTDIPADTSPDPNSAFGGIGVKVPRVGWQPVDPMVGDSLEAGMNVMGGTALTAPGNAVGAGPSLRSAVKFNDRVYRAKPGETHMDALSLVKDDRANANLWADRGYIDHRGRFLNREQGQAYALEHGLLDDPRVPSWAKTQSELISENLPEVINKRGGPLTIGAGATDRRAAAVAGLDDIDRIIEGERALKGAAHEPASPAATAPAELPAAGAAPEVGPGGGGQAGARGLPEAQAAAARWAGERKPLEGIPGALKIGEDYFVPGPIGKIHDVAEDYMRTVHPNRPYTPPDRYYPLDPEHSKAIAQAYEEMKHTPNDPATKASYDALIDETAKQYEAIKKTGLKIEPIPAGAPDPYATNPRLAAWDVAENNHLWFFPTEGGFGTVNKITDNPMLRKTGEKIGDHELLANDMFRIVHDYFGHLKQGHGFRAAGEDNAWRTHAAMYSDLARPAMTTETRGQNSWVNYGPHGEKNRTASGADTIYADQKVGLMPEWTMRDRNSPPPMVFYHGTPHSFDRFDISKIGAGEGNQAYGHGLYFAGHEPVSEWYRHQLATRHDPLLKKYKLQEVGHVIGGHLSDAGGDAAELAKQYKMLQQRLIEGGLTDKATKNMIAEYDRRIAYLNDPERSRGHMYQIAADVDPQKLLDYDIPFKEQSAHVQGRTGPMLEESVKRQTDAIKHSLQKGTSGTGRWERPLLPGVRAGLEGRLMMLEQAGHSSFPGKEIYKRAGLPAKNETEGSVRAAKRLLAEDIPGLRYADAGSRTPGQKGSHNYVMFDDSMLRILRKYGVVGIPAAGVLGADGEVRRAEGGRVAAFGVLSPAEEAEMNPPPRLTFARPEPDTSPVRFRTASPLVNITERDIDRGIDVGLGAATVGPSKGLPVGRVADDTGAAMTAARRSKRYAEPEYGPSGGHIFNKGVENPPDPSIQTVADPHRMMFPGIYRDPRIIAEEAAARVGPEDEMMKRLWGVTRGDLREMAQGRVGNEAPVVPMGGPRSRGSLAAQNIQTPQNTQRLIDILEEGGKHEGLRTADAWYIMDPVYRRMVEMGVNDPAAAYRHLNTLTGMASPGSDVATEIARGTAAHWLDRQGRFGDFQKYAGIPEEMRGRVKFPGDMRKVPGHPYHRTSQSDPMAKYLEHGSIQSDAPKVPLYVQASGVPETGFQTAGPVGDAHFSRGVGLSDTRKGPTDVQGSFSRSEYQTLQPWWQHEVAGAAGLESVPAQARLWTVLGPQTGVQSQLGAPKLEILTKQIMEAAQRLRISPEKARDMILQGKAGAFERGGAVVDAAMSVARGIKRAKGGKVHVGPIVGDTGGRADKRPMRVPNGCYVLTADHVSGMGEGNTGAGMKRLSEMFPKSKPSRMRNLPDAVPIYAADGEFIVSPEDIEDRYGDLDRGHRILDEWQTSERKKLIEELATLAPPAQD